MAIGNHELYIYANALDMHTNFAPQLKGRYLTSNVNITVADKQGNPVSIPLGNRFAKFKTRKGRRVTAFGVLFNFTGNDKNTTVQQVSDMVNEKWFHDAIRDEPDFFLVTGHMPVQRDDFPLVFNAIRAVHSSTPIIILGGHSHIRDCVQLDGRSMALESGRYMETIGWMSMDLDRRGSKKDLKFSRRYLDANRVTYEFHSRKKSKKFSTPLGKRITNGLLDLAKRFDLDFMFGTAPQDYVINQAPYPSNRSLLSLYAEQVVPVSLSINNTRSSIPSYFVTNSGSQRFDVFAGPFTKNDQIVASPFTNKFLFISNVTLSTATSVLPILNSQGELRRSLDDLERREKELYAKGNIDIRFRQWLEAMDKRMGEEKRAAGNLTLGYVTHDSCPGVGDDIPHAPLPFFSFPDFIASETPSVSSDTAIDFIFVDFIQDQLLNVLNSVQKDRIFSADDVQVCHDPRFATMHITSVVNPNTNSAGDVCVLLLSYGQNMVFVGKPRTYEKLERIAREEFSLDEKAALVFETSTLDICRQQKVRISKGAYGAMWQCLDALSVAVKPDENSSVEVTNFPVASSSHHAEELASSGASVENGAASSSSNDDEDDEDDGYGEEEAEQPPPPRNRRGITNRVMSTPPPDDSEEAPQEENRDEGEDGPPSDSSSTEEPTNELNEQEEEVPNARAASEPVHEEEEEVAEEEEEEQEADAAPPVPEADVIDHPQEAPESPRRPVARQESLDDQEWAEARASSIIRPPLPGLRTPLVQTASIPSSPIRGAAERETPSSSQVVLPPSRASASSAILRNIRSPRPAAPPAIASHVYPPGSQGSESSSRTVTPTYEPPHSQHLHITITYEDQSVEFKTRGRHTIKKVLTSACTQFGLDSRRATLALERDIDSEMTSTPCAPDMTLAACGVTDGSQFIIRMD
ncbi:hypothetical protein EYR36_003498 [Pleurotus pulmonarius]|nr:hypothetical protein EYR36_003498 [Pleurotus pulmonarius]